MKNIEQQKSRELRQSGYSCRQISTLLNVAPSSVSMWTKDIVLTKQQKDDLLHRRILTPGQLSASDKNKQYHKDKHNIWEKTGYNLARNNISFKLLCCLYWGEGRKTGSTTSIANSDPLLIKVFTEWLINNKYDYSFRITYHKDNWPNDIEIIKFWKSHIPSLTNDRIRKSCIIIKNIASKNKKIGKCKYGTVTICVKKSVILLYQIFGGIKYIRENGL